MLKKNLILICVIIFLLLLFCLLWTDVKWEDLIAFSSHSVFMGLEGYLHINAAKPEEKLCIFVKI